MEPDNWVVEVELTQKHNKEYWFRVRYTQTQEEANTYMVQRALITGRRYRVVNTAKENKNGKDRNGSAG